MMMDKMNRRAFLKSAGTVALAVAAAGVLTACGEDAPAPAPVDKPTENQTGLNVSNMAITIGQMGNNDNTKKYYTFFEFTVKNTSNTAITLSKANFTAKVDGSAEKKADSIYDMVQNDNHVNMTSFNTKQLDAGASAPIAVTVVIDEATYLSWNSRAHKLDLMVHNNDKSTTFSCQVEAKPAVKK